jgi:pyrimidine-specific ribonucleoside hydrolase
MQNFFLDLETSDPDDIFALALLATHPRSNLLGVTVHPGGEDQVGLVKFVLESLGKVLIPVGAGSPKDLRTRVSEFHYRWLGNTPQEKPDGSATEVIEDVLKKNERVHLVTGAALTNIARVNHPTFSTWTCQGGFAGSNIMPPETQLPKFAGLLTCPTFNLNGDPKAALKLLDLKFTEIKTRRMVPKSICHGVFWGPEFNKKVPQGSHFGLDMIKRGMKVYFERHPQGKALHDVIAAVAAIETTLGSWVRVEPYRQEGKWGCRHTEDPNAPEILTSFNQDVFFETLSQ